MASIPTAIGAFEGGRREQQAASALREVLERELGIRTVPTYYRLLALEEGESNPDIIQKAADRVAKDLHTRQNKRGMFELLNLVSLAKLTLLDAAKKAAYDQSLAQRTKAVAASTRTDVERVVPHVPLAPEPPPIIKAEPLATARNEEPSTLQQYWKHAAATAAGITFAIGGLLYATSGDDTSVSAKDTDSAPVKAPKVPGESEAPVTPVAMPKDEQKIQKIPSAQPTFVGTEQYDNSALSPAVPAKQPPEVTVVRPAPSVAPEPAPLKKGLPLETAVAMQNPAPQAPARKEAPVVDKAEVQKFREDLRRRLGIDDTKNEKPTAAQIDRIREYLKEPLIRDSAVEAKGCMEQMFTFALQIGDLERLHAAYLDIKASSFFPKEEIQLCAKLTKSLAIQKGDIAIASALLDDQVQLGAVKKEEAAKERAEILMTAASSPELRRDAEKRAAMAHKLVKTAESVANEQMDPALAKTLLSKARSLPIADADERKAFLLEETRVKTIVDELQKFQDAQQALKANPSNANARTIVSDYWFAKGNATEGLAALQSDHPKSQLANDTAAMLANPRNVTGKKAFVAGELWMKEAEASKNGAGAGKKELARKLFLLAIADTNDPLDALAMVDAKKMLATLGDVPKAPTPKPEMATPQPDAKEQNVMNVPGQEPTRPEYVAKEAVWNAETGSWYLLLPNSMTFKEAAQAAASVRAVPVIIDSKEENEFVYQLPGKPTETWIGYIKGPDGKLYTLDGRPAPYENWNGGEGKTPGEKHVFMMWGGKHADSYPDKKARVVLEWKAPAPVSTARRP